MPGQVLITGVTGHIGSAVLIKALKDGYGVRAAVRSLSSKDKILKAAPIKDNGLAEKLTFVEVPNIQDPSAYTEAIKDVDYVIHLASPLMRPEFASTDMNETVVAPAVQGTLNVLEAALTNPKVKRVVITSSVVANMGFDGAEHADARTRKPVPPVTDLASAYLASKHAALLASDRFMDENKPHFDLVNIHPAFVVGRKELAATAEEALSGTNAFPLTIVLQGVQPTSTIGATVSLEDVAHLHVESLKLPGKENRGFGAIGRFNPNDVFPIVKKHFPRAVEEGILKEPAGEQTVHYMNWDASETEKVFGLKFKTVEEQIVPVVQQYLELLGKA